MILDGQELRGARLDPLRRGGALALGAVAVAARVIRDLPMAAPVALLDVPAAGRGPALRDVAQCAALSRREDGGEGVEEGGSMIADDIGHFEPMRDHGWRRPSVGSSSRSSGLDVASRTAAET